MLKQALQTATVAAREAGANMRKHLHSKKRINEEWQHDIKLELDVKNQKLIEKILLKDFPDIAVLGEEGTIGDLQSEYRWVVDPIDGTVNFAYGFPHAAVCIALQRRLPKSPAKAKEFPDLNYETVVGVIYDPFLDELFTAIRGQKARLNGRILKVSQRKELREAIVAVGFAKKKATLDEILPAFNRLIYKIRKVRMMGSAALSMAYVAAGRIDAYREVGIRLWDIAAGGLLIECAGGDFHNTPMDADHTYRLIANNGHLRNKIKRIIG